MHIPHGKYTETTRKTASHLFPCVSQQDQESDDIMAYNLLQAQSVCVYAKPSCW